MNLKKPFQLIFVGAVLLAAGATPASAQLRTSGSVLEVIDAKTVVVSVHTGRITVELQYIDVPEPSQSMHAVITDHVRRMLIGKTIELSASRFARTSATGKITLNGVDISQQLLRDGAAWHLPIEMTGQAKNEFDEYAGSELLAKQEKRGIWSVAGLRPPWELRAEEDQMRRAAESERRRQHPTRVGVTPYQTDTRRKTAPQTASSEVTQRSQMDAWVATFALSKNEGYGLHVYNDPNGRYQSVYTSPIILDFSSPAGKEKLECRILYVTGTRYDGVQAKMFVIGFRAISEDYRFSKVRTRLTGMADRSALQFSPLLGGIRGQGMIGNGGIASGEIMYFGTNKATLKKIANARKVEFRINKLSAVVPVEARDLFRQLAVAGD